MAEILQIRGAGALSGQAADEPPTPALVNVSITLTMPEAGSLHARSAGASRVLQGLFHTAIRAVLDTNDVLELAYYAGDNAFNNAINPTEIGQHCLEQVNCVLAELRG